jgi:hypothetical protein
VTRSLKTSVTHSPHFLAKRLGEVSVVGDDEYTSFKDLESFDEGSE